MASGVAPLSDRELLAVLLRAGWGEDTALDLADRLLVRFGSLRALRAAEIGELTAVKGIGSAKAASVKAGLELGRRAAAEPMTPGDTVTGPKKVYEHCRACLTDERREVFLALHLDTRSRILRTETISIGTLDASLVHPREVFASAVKEGTSHLILAHNHPSGDATPSAEDREVTRRLAEVGRLVGIPVLDHVIVGEGGDFRSLAETMQLG